MCIHRTACLTPHSCLWNVRWPQAINIHLGAKLHRYNATPNESLCYQQHQTCHMLSQQINPGKHLISNFWQNIKWWIHTEAIRAEQQTPEPKGSYIWCQIIGPTIYHHLHPPPLHPPPLHPPPPTNSSFNVNRLKHFTVLLFLPTSALLIWNWGRILDILTY